MAPLRSILLRLDILLGTLRLVEWVHLLLQAVPLNMEVDRHNTELNRQLEAALLRNNMRTETMPSRLKELAEVKRNLLLA